MATAKDGASTLYLIDATAYVFRAFHALPPLTNRTGRPTNAVYGFTTMILRLLREERPDRVAVVFDAGGPTFRDEMFGAYKAQRPPMPDDLIGQLPFVRRVVAAMRLPTLAEPGVEADDVIASLATRFAPEIDSIVVVSGDKDLMQLVGGNVVLFDPMKNQRIGVAEVEKRFGVPPDQVVEVQGLMGDSVDNVPGVPGVGEKTARALVQHFGTIEAMLERSEEIETIVGLRGAKGVRAKVEANVEGARVSRRLVELRRDLELSVSLEDLRAPSPDWAALRALFEELDFEKLMSQLSPPKVEPSGTTGWVGSSEEWTALAGALAGRPHVAVEFYGARPEKAPAGLALALDPTEACVVPFGESGVDPGALGALVGPSAPALASADLKATWLALDAMGYRAERLGFDAGLASYVLDGGRSSHRLDDLAREFLGITLATGLADDDTGAGEAAAEAARIVLRLEPVLRASLEAEGVRALYDDVELPLVAILGAMERRGVRVDGEVLRTLGVELAATLEQLEAEIHELAGEPINVSSPAQLREILFRKLGLSTKGVRKGKTGLSTDVDVLRRLADEHPLPGKILEYRGVAKLRSTYVDGLLAEIDPATSRVHTTFQQTVAATGRLSSTNPNLQNVPVRTADGRRIREAFVAEPGCRLVSADYSQIELRVLAHVSADPVLVEAFRSGEDIHRRTASEVFHVEPSAVEPAQRRAAKAINFGLLYGMGAARLARDLDIARDEAESYVERYFERLPGVRRYLAEAVDHARETGFATTIFGRRRSIPGLGAGGGARAFAERAAVNTPIQGAAADLVKLAMVRVDRALQRENLRAAMILQVHDELIVEAPEGEVAAVATLLEREMKAAADLAVPLAVEVTSGSCWKDLH